MLLACSLMLLYLKPLICLDMLFQDTDKVCNMNRKQLEKMFNFAVRQNHFLFNGKIYDQIDGVAMGSPLGPVLANVYVTGSFRASPLLKVL